MNIIFHLNGNNERKFKAFISLALSHLQFSTSVEIYDNNLKLL